MSARMDTGKESSTLTVKPQQCRNESQGRTRLPEGVVDNVVAQRCYLRDLRTVFRGL